MEKSGAPNIFVTTIDTHLAPKLEHDLISQGFTISHPPYTIFSAQKKGVTCTLYSSGKLTVQGKEKEAFLTFYLEPEILQDLSFSYPETMVNWTARIGIDEAGKGDFFGPLCIAGVYADQKGIQHLLSIGVKDSKKINDKNILILSKKIKEAVPHSIVRISPEKYNQMYDSFKNLNQLLAWGHAAAISELVDKTRCHEVIIDQFGGEHLVTRALEKKKIEVNLTQRHGAESDPVVAAASILARAAFLEGLEKLGNTLSCILPKGASKQVIETGKALVNKHGEDILLTVAKTHFKTMEDILRDL